MWGLYFIIGIMKIQSPNVLFQYKINRILEKIKENSPINRFVLCRLLMINPRQYQDMQPYLEEGYADKIEFNPGTKEWRWIEKIEEKPITKVPESLEEALHDE